METGVSRASYYVRAPRLSQAPSALKPGRPQTPSFTFLRVTAGFYLSQVTPPGAGCGTATPGRGPATGLIYFPTVGGSALTARRPARNMRVEEYAGVSGRGRLRSRPFSFWALRKAGHQQVRPQDGNVE